MNLFVVVVALARVRQALSDLGGAVELAAAPAWARTSPSCRMRSSRGRRTLCAGRRPARCRARSWGRSSRSGRWRQQPTLAAHHRCHAPLEQHARLAGSRRRRRSAPPTPSRKMTLSAVLNAHLVSLSFLYSFSCIVQHNRSYHDENTASRPICEVKHHRALSVLGWGTTWEA